MTTPLKFESDVFTEIVAGIELSPRCTVRQVPKRFSVESLGTYDRCGSPAVWSITAQCCSGIGLACQRCLDVYVAHFNGLVPVEHYCGRLWPLGTAFSTAWKAVRL